MLIPAIIIGFTIGTYLGDGLYRLEKKWIEKRNATKTTDRKEKN